MNRKEEIIHATLELASKQGLRSLSMEQIAKKVGIKKPSLYNHFKSKSELIVATYEYLRKNAKEKNVFFDADFKELIEGNSVEQILKTAVERYFKMSCENELLSFYKVIYSERTINPVAAKIMTDETEKMITMTENLFCVLKARGKISIEDIDAAALSFAMTVHSIMDYQLDKKTSGDSPSDAMLDSFLSWFCRQIIGGKNHEKQQTD